MERSQQKEDGLKKQLEEALKEVRGLHVYGSKMGGKGFQSFFHEKKNNPIDLCVVAFCFI